MKGCSRDSAIRNSDREHFCFLALQRAHVFAVQVPFLSFLLIDREFINAQN